MPRPRNGHDTLTPAELRVLKALADGARGQKGAAAALGIQATTVNTHLINVRAKLAAKTNIHAVAMAQARGLFVTHAAGNT